VDLKPDVVVVDIHMPYVNGLSACRQIKGASPEMKIIVLTGDSEPGTRERALNAGASAFVLKHSMADDLIPAIQNALLDRS
jgi:DNA-binding NarL/FixJ family response regulator